MHTKKHVCYANLLFDVCIGGMHVWFTNIYVNAEWEWNDNDDLQ